MIDHTETDKPVHTESGTTAEAITNLAESVWQPDHDVP